ncbi:MAG: hypothetical protein MZW92_05105 [Comamonadaceae bacterium]|nr:hypothetical protein [Comamonadaceae bacterium]
MMRGGAGGPAVSPLEATMLITREDAIVVDVREPAGVRRRPPAERPPHPGGRHR